MKGNNTHMKNRDKMNNEVRALITKALQSGDENAMVDAMGTLASTIENQVMAEARAEARRIGNDTTVLAQRGQHQLTTEERAYYKAVQENRGFTNLDVTLPQTIFDRVFEDLEKEHPLLSIINFENTSAITKWIVSKPGSKIAKWGKLSSAIVQELEASFDEVSTVQCKLSAFMPVSKDMLELGATYLDRYVRMVLTEAIAGALEEALLIGTGKDMPIGMCMDLKKAAVDDEKQMKDALPLKDLTPQTIGSKIMSKLTKGGTRAVSTILVVVNPLDYWSRIFPSITHLVDGKYVKGDLCVPNTTIQSPYMPLGKMVCGVAKDYFCGVGTTAKTTFSDDYRFLEDERIYVAKAHCNGKPKDNESFYLYDITAIGEGVTVEELAKANKGAKAKTEDGK